MGKSGEGGEGGYARHFSGQAGESIGGIFPAEGAGGEEEGALDLAGDGFWLRRCGDGIRRAGEGLGDKTAVFCGRALAKRESGKRVAGEFLFARAGVVVEAADTGMIGP